jgi:hypothetical protein
MLCSTRGKSEMSIKPGKASTRNYRKEYAGGGIVDPDNPGLGEQGRSMFFKPASVPTGEGELGQLGHTQFVGDQRFRSQADEPEDPRLNVPVGHPIGTGRPPD